MSLSVTRMPAARFGQCPVMTPQDTTSHCDLVLCGRKRLLNVGLVGRHGRLLGLTDDWRVRLQAREETAERQVRIHPPRQCQPRVESRPAPDAV